MHDDRFQLIQITDDYQGYRHDEPFLIFISMTVRMIYFAFDDFSVNANGRQYLWLDGGNAFSL